jgi:tritrans,polycis-undecaprenyl-diphosphate synthase [geranylgeranyl-diphosphate specific]
MWKKHLERLEDRALETRFARQVLSSIKNNRLFSAVYREMERVYAKKLVAEVRKNPVPQHVAIIMDGNRRYALLRGMPPTRGHEAGKDKLEQVVQWGKELDIQALTVFAFSTDNFKREKEEVDHLMDLFEQDLRRLAESEHVEKNRVNIRVIGQTDLLPERVRRAAEDIARKTANFSDYFCNIAIGYGGREEIVDAIRRIVRDLGSGKITEKDLSKDLLASYLYTAHLPLPDPDLILRTSGEERVSNFLLWQLAYAELYFTDVYWPSFKKTDFLKAIMSYQQRKKRYGT